MEMAARRPKTIAELATVHGVGTAKLKRYGDTFLAAIQSAGV
jgi:superfamily II DNA helicase RecQ